MQAQKGAGLVPGCATGKGRAGLWTEGCLAPGPGALVLLLLEDRRWGQRRSFDMCLPCTLHHCPCQSDSRRSPCHLVLLMSGDAIVHLSQCLWLRGAAANAPGPHGVRTRPLQSLGGSTYKRPVGEGLPPLKGTGNTSL